MRVVVLLALLASAVNAQSLPLRQSQLDFSARDENYRVPLDSTVNARWLGGGVSAPRWSPDGQWLYFQYALTPSPAMEGMQPDDPWWRVSRDARRVEQVTREAALEIPAQMRHTRNGQRAVWFHRGALQYWKRGAVTRTLLQRVEAINPQWTHDERAVRWLEGNNLWEIDPETGSLVQLTRALQQRDSSRTDRQRAELVRQQLEIFDFTQAQKAARDSMYRRQVAERWAQPITVPYKEGETISFLQVPAGGRYATFLITPRVQTTQTTFSDYVNDSGIVVQRSSRPKVGSPVPVRRAMFSCLLPQ